ncbi:alpha/beta hydrolase [Actinomadura citrea]|uniref:Pimeloyl-ACP methyl ester carboxylesterase n=1 Tax=Actinomadura citrea TaxID=46158 RepID=A0A7Y9KAT1_9ACTN|nr:alpha/beta hydrolase [Actinomadura citrea]NYE10491.1 pimeloyl-ACP methyl ester carboxylesterase [Actinomadura citrea]GGT72641.1 peptidase [Actinomadura citrea]
MLRRNRLALVGAAAAGTVALAGVALPATASPTPPAPRSPSAIGWRACGDDGKAECATLRLPIDWSRPDGPTFGLAIARRQALDQDARVGTLVFGPGGPGDSGVQRVTRLKGGIDRFSDELRRRFDIVSFDPRGIGASHPVTCSADLLRAAPSPMIKSAAQFRATLDHNARLRADCRARTGPLYDHADTLSTVRDVDAIRAALGESKLTFHGSSYGTLLGEMYAETFPRRVRAMVLESVDDHSIPDARRFLTSELAAAQDSFDQFAAWCGRTRECALHGKDVRAIWRDLRARADRGELPDPSSPGTALPEFGLVLMAYKSFYGPDWAELASKLAALDAAPPLRAGARPAAAQAAGETATDPFTAQFCSDWSLPVRDYGEYARLMRRTEKVAPDMTFARPVMAISACLGRPQPVRNPQHRLDVRGSAPILLSNAVHDPATPYAWARNVARQLGPTGRLLTYEGAGHGSYDRGPCMQNTIDAYLTSLTLPPPGTTCPAQ